MKKMLYILPYFPSYSINGSVGPKNVTIRWLSYLENKYEITVYIVCKKCNVSYIESVCDKYPLIKFKTFEVEINFFYKLYFMVKNRFPKFTLSYYSTRLSSHLKKMDKDKFDLIVFDYFYIAFYIKCVSHNVPSFLLAHDAYSMREYRAFQYKNTLLKKLSSGIKWFLLRSYEKRIYCFFSKVITVSTIDSEYLMRLIKRDVGTLPIPLSEDWLGETWEPNYHKENIKLLISVPVNSDDILNEAIIFIEEVLPKILIKFPYLQVTVWGKGVITLKKRISLNETTSLKFIDFVDDYKAFLKQNWIFIYPRKVGSGFHGKLIELMSLGLVIIGWDKLMIPLGGEQARDYIHYKNISEVGVWLERNLDNYTALHEISKKAKQYANDNLNIDIVGERFLNILEGEERN